MASDKKRRKASKQNRKAAAPSPAGPFRHPDGDRRRRGGPSAKDAIKHKLKMREVGMPPESQGEPMM